MVNISSSEQYEPVWDMLQKIRSAMGKCDAKYQLAGYIELDDAFFEIGDPHQKPCNYLVANICAII